MPDQPAALHPSSPFKHIDEGDEGEEHRAHVEGQEESLRGAPGRRVDDVHVGSLDGDLQACRRSPASRSPGP